MCFEKEDSAVWWWGGLVDLTYFILYIKGAVSN